MSQQPKEPPKPTYSYQATLRATAIVTFILVALFLVGMFIFFLPGAVSNGIGGIIGWLVAAVLIGGVVLDRWFKVQRRLKGGK